MHTSAILASLVGLAGLTIAGHPQGRPSAEPPVHTVPAEWVDHPHHANNTHSPVKRDALGVYECHGQNWYGPCTWTKADGGSCHNRLYGPGGSMGPDSGLTCRIYLDFNCPTTPGWSVDGFQAPGIPEYQMNGWLKSAGMPSGPLSYKCRKS